MRNKIYSVIVILLSSLILVYACNSNSLTNLDDIVFAEKDVSYLHQVEPFLRFTCAFVGCHGQSAAGGIVLNDYFEMMKEPGLVIPGNADGSQLIQILEEKLPHFTYYERSRINQNHLTGMRTWVNEGAKNN
ncbi:MAG: hypothetical protein CVV22_10895 [Ignavibacteriae bacterium HGW-Ignavibacteriae-1]|jgi:hypothetical protein|nr:MAG: hypothetical protein CVV22_10895 [Ignavibacteriae bacterium HGW-Ignavibacteriae-1]